MQQHLCLPRRQGEMTQRKIWIDLNYIYIYISLNAEVLESVLELGVGHVDGQLVQHLRLLRVEVEAHLAQPLKVAVVVHLESQGLFQV